MPSSTSRNTCLPTKQKRLELCSLDEGIPNVAALVQELFMSLFISVYNHEEEDGRYTAESFCELPDYDEVCWLFGWLVLV